MLAAGTLRHLIDIITPKAEQNDVGQMEYDYTIADEGEPPIATKVTTWARVEYTSQNKTGDGEVQNAGQASFLVQMRYNDAVTYRDRIDYDGKVLMVTGIGHDVLKTSTELECEEADL